ncbi:MAG: hypothetical protein PWP11_3028 [Thauera sp.]|nr:prevent-host-death protein [Thauera sp.]MDI3491751.1 hypothetical protein [Thauera sp.]
MTIKKQDIVSMGTARAQLPEFAAWLEAGVERSSSKNSHVAPVDSHRRGLPHPHALMLDEARRGLEDVETGRTFEAREALTERRRARSGSASGTK